MLILAALAIGILCAALFAAIPLAVGWLVGCIIRKITGRPD